MGSPSRRIDSVGGNDITGYELLSFLNHKESGLNPQWQPFNNFTIKTYFQKAYNNIIDSAWSIDDSSSVALVTAFMTVGQCSMCWASRL